MNTKLTLTMEESVIRKAKKYARSKGRSLSDMIGNYLKIVSGDEANEFELTPIVKSLKGSFKAPPDFDYKKELEKALSKKHFSHG